MSGRRKRLKTANFRHSSSSGSFHQNGRFRLESGTCPVHLAGARGEVKDMTSVATWPACGSPFRS